METHIKNSNPTPDRGGFHGLRSLSSVAFVFALFVMAPRAAAQALAYDGFSGTPGVDLAGRTGGSGWTSAWSDVGVDATKVMSFGLSYAGLATTQGAAVTPDASGVWPNSVYQRSFQPAPAGVDTLYVSFLMRDDTANSSWGGLTFGQWPSAMSVGAPAGYYEFGLLTSQGLGDFSGTPIAQGKTALVVVRIQKNTSGSGITYRLYVDPSVGSAEPTSPAATFSLGSVQTLPTALSIDNGTGITTDEIRIGTTWTSVLPAAYDPWTDMGFAKPGTSGAPRLVGLGTLEGNTLNTLQLSKALPNSVAWLAIGTQAINAPVLGGLLVPDPLIIVTQSTTVNGTTNYRALWPAGVPSGQSIYAQYWILDPVATFGVSASNGLQGTTL